MECMQQSINPNRGYIYETLLKIDQMQKAANIENACEGCEGGLLSTYYNTKPITVYLCGGSKLTVEIPDSETTTTYFRIEKVKNDCVILRLLQKNCQALECLNYTVVLQISCICCLQCFAPICCDECTNKCNQA